jgi:hemerythrin-like domain-containing protein
MRPLPKAKTWITLVLSLGFFLLVVREVARETPSDGVRRTEPLRQNLAQLRRILGTLERTLESVHEASEAEQIALMKSGVLTLKEYLLPHLAAEEEALHPSVDRQIPASSARLTEAMKREHDIMRRWIGDMERLADQPMPDHNAFARRGERLLGLIEAHFEVDEEILFPVLDQIGPLTRGGRPRN